MNHKKVNDWLDIQPHSEFTLNSMVKPTEQAEFLTIIEKRYDYTYNGLIVEKKAFKIGISDIESYFSNFDFPESHESSFGAFRKYGLKQFATNFIECVKNKKINTATRKQALITLISLKDYLSTGKASYLKSRHFAKM